MERDPLNIEGRLVADKYRIEQLVAQGGFAAVYRATHTIWNKPVAIKFFTGFSGAPIDERIILQEAFVREGALLTELSSQTAGIVQARDIGEHVTPDGQWLPFMVLEWLEGTTLDDLLAREQQQGLGPWTLQQVFPLIAQIASALDVAHRRGIAHRDIKPANLFVVGTGARSGTATVKILDFGVAKIFDDTELKAALARTGAGVTAFTPQYGAPEQFTRSFGPTGPWTDVFALALVAVELLSARPALQGAGFVDLGLCAGDRTRRPTPWAMGVAVPESVERVFTLALSVDPAQRYVRAGDFLSALAAALQSPSTQPSERFATPVPTPQPTSLAPTLADHASAPRPAAPSTRPLQGLTSSSPSQTERERRGRGLLLVTLGVLSAAGAFVFGRQLLPGTAPPTTPGPRLASALPAPAPPPEVQCPERMARIPAGQYFRGSDAKDAPDNQKPAHHVELPAFCFDLYEVSADQYKACSDSGRCKRAATEVDWPGISQADRKLYSSLCTFGQADHGDYPINCVNWQMADIFCQAYGKRLPTEAEWEYAARGPDGRVYPWGDEPPTAQHLNACGSECAKWGRSHGTLLDALYSADDGYPTLAPVGKFPLGRSRFGPFDVAGNVWEWVADWYGEYAPQPLVNPRGPDHGEKKVIRGGAWNGSYSDWLKPAFRYGQDPSALSYGIGFRCAKSL